MEVRSGLMKNIVKYPLVLFCVAAAAGLALSVTFALTFNTIRQKEKQKVTRAIVSSFWNVEMPPGARWENYAELDGTGIYAAYTDETHTTVMGYAAQGRAPGYSSPIKVMVGARPLGGGQYRILGVKVISQQETPGLGARVSDVYTSDTLWTFLASVFGGGEVENPPVLPHVRAAAEALKVPPESFPPRPAFQEQFAGKIVTVKDDKVSGLELSKTGWSEVTEGRFLPGNKVAAMTGATISSKAAVDAVYQAVKNIHKTLAARSAE